MNFKQKLTTFANKTLDVAGQAAKSNFGVDIGDQVTNVCELAKQDVPVNDAVSPYSGLRDYVFISYQWDSQPIVLKIKDRLKEDGYKVWVDVEEMTGSINEAMALAVEHASIVLVCMTSKYKASVNCKKEAEYTDAKNKPVIPLMLEKGYQPDGWLGLVLGKKLYVAFHDSKDFENNYKLLKDQLSKYDIQPQKESK